MNIIKVRQDKRKLVISKIANTIKKVFSADLGIDKEVMISECCFETGSSRRTALEYLQIALFQFKTKEIKENNRTLIVEVSENIPSPDLSKEEKELLDTDLVNVPNNSFYGKSKDGKNYSNPTGLNNSNPTGLNNSNPTEGVEEAVNLNPTGQETKS